MKLKTLFCLLILPFIFSSCFKETREIFKGALVEFNYTVTRAKAPGFTFPINTVKGGKGDTLRLQINLVGAQRANNEVVKVKATSFGNADYEDATEGKHFAFVNNGEVTIPANSSFADCMVILPANDDIGSYYIVVELEGNAALPPSLNYNKVGLKISL